MIRSHGLPSLLVAVVALAPLTSAAAEEGFVPLFDGKTLEGWEQHGGDAEYTVEDGAIVGTSVPKTPNSFLATKKTYGDFILELEFKVDPALNSGVQFRSNVFDKPTKVGKKRIPAGRVHGYQVEIDPSPRAYTGGIYDEGRRGWLYNLAGEKNAKARKAFKQDEWNHFRVEAVGDSIKTWINGVPAANLKDDMTAKGFIALQVHGVGNKQEKIGKQVRWRNLKIKELK